MTGGRRAPAPWKLGVLSALYFAQGLPFGFQSNALPLFLTELGVSMREVGFARALAVPWMLKALWGPFVDRAHSRKAWIIPMQLGLVATCVAAAFVPLGRETLTPFLLCVLLMNAFAATQDVAVDGLAVDLLEPRELGAGNAAQVVGYKVGMLVGGGALVALTATQGTRGLFLSMAAIGLVVAAVAWRVPEPPRREAERAPVAARELLRVLRVIVTRPGAWWLLGAVATYKLGETLADAMFGAWLVRVHALPKEQVALWLGSWGIAASIAGSFLGGLLATRLELRRAVLVAGTLRLSPLALQWALVAGWLEVGPQSVVPITVAEHLFGGVLTTTMFALMMSQVDRRIGATHFTVLATIEVAGKAAPGLFSGLLVDALGFGPVFLLSVLLSAAFLAVAAQVRPQRVESTEKLT
jgi:MFS family permease